MKKIIVLILLLPVLLSAQKNNPALMDEYMQAQVNVNEFTGVVLIAQKGQIILKAESNTKFFSDDNPEAIFEFELDGNRKITKAYFTVSGRKYEMKKL